VQGLHDWRQIVGVKRERLRGIVGVKRERLREIVGVASAPQRLMIWHEMRLALWCRDQVEKGLQAALE
jgi:hypothetical protein